MNFATAVTKLFADGDVGQSLLTELGLPVESFPAAATWNQFTAHSDAEKVALRKHTAAAAPYEPNKSYLTTESSAKLLTRFVDLNAGVVLFTPNHGLWTSDDIYAAHQRWSGGYSLMVCHLRLGPCLDQALAGSSLSPTGLRESQQPTLHG
jgi:hypothetical protein